MFSTFCLNNASCNCHDTISYKFLRCIPNCINLLQSAHQSPQKHKVNCLDHGLAYHNSCFQTNQLQSYYDPILKGQNQTEPDQTFFPSPQTKVVWQHETRLQNVHNKIIYLSRYLLLLANFINHHIKISVIICLSEQVILNTCTYA